MKIIAKSDPESQAFWEDVATVASEVSTWPEWKGGKGAIPTAEEQRSLIDDAERYRWLKQFFRPSKKGGLFEAEFAIDRNFEETLDAAIDRARNRGENE